MNLKTKITEIKKQFGVQLRVMLPKAVYKLISAIKFGCWAYKHNDIFNENMFKMLSDILTLLLKVSTEDKHYMTEIVVTNPQTGIAQPIVNIWAGAGINAEPLKRIQELIEENQMLKDRLRST